MVKIVVTDCSWGNIDVEKRYLPSDAVVELYQCKTEEEVMEVCKDADAVMSEYAPITEKVLHSMRKCKIISNSAIGTDNIDVEAATKLGIAVANVSGYCDNEVADHTVALLLSLNRCVIRYKKMLDEKIWDIDCGCELRRLSGQTMGLVGFGRIARCVATRAAAFGLRLVAYDPYVAQEIGNKFNTKLVRLDELLETSDIISCHLPLMRETFHFFDSDKFIKMKKKPIFINTSRGKVVDIEALYKALKDGLLKCAGLDVLENEPPSFQESIFELDNVIITPHVGFYSKEALFEVRRRSAQNITKFLQETKLEEV